jgi:hypothetical protein
MQAAAEEEGHGRLVAEAFRRGDFPGGVDVALGGGLEVLGRLEVPDQRELGVGDLLLGVVHVAHDPLHVRLSGAEPHLADDDVAEFNDVRGRDFEDGGLVRGLQGVELELPRAVGAGFGLLFLAGELDRDLLARVSPAPDGHGGPLLQNHVVAENVRQFDRGLDGAGHEPQGRQRGEANPFHPDLPFTCGGAREAASQFL